MTTAFEGTRGPGEPKLPSAVGILWRLLWRPFELRELLFELGVDHPYGSVGELARLGKHEPNARLYLRRLLLLTLFFGPLSNFLLGFLMVALGVPLRGGYFFTSLFGVAIALGFSLIASAPLGAIVGTLGAVTGFFAAHVAPAGALGAPRGPEVGIAVGLCSSLMLGLGVGSIFALRNGGVPTLNRLQVTTVIVALLGAATWSFRSMQFGSAVAAITIPGFLLWAYRLPIYALELAWQAVLLGVQRVTGWSTLRLSPVHFHNLALFPSPLLRRHLDLAIEQRPADPWIGRTVSAALFSPGNAAFALELLRANFPDEFGDEGPP